MSGTMGPRRRTRTSDSSLHFCWTHTVALERGMPEMVGWNGSDDVILDVDIFGDVRHTYLVWNSIHLPWVLLGT